MSTLPTGQHTNPPLAPIPQHFWTHQLHQPFPELARRPPVYPSGPQYDRANDRIMDCFGSDGNIYPFTAADTQINAAKGRLMRRFDVTGRKRIEKRTSDAVRLDTPAAAGLLLTSIRAVSMHVVSTHF